MSNCVNLKIWENSVEAFRKIKNQAGSRTLLGGSIFDMGIYVASQEWNQKISAEEVTHYAK